MNDEIEGYRQNRGPLWCAIFDTLRDYRLSNMADDETGEPGFPLVDVMSNSGGGATIATGEMEMVALADEISLAYEATKPAPASEAVGGWKLVPVEPTEAMIREGNVARISVGADPNTRDTYRAMLAAAPAIEPRPEAVAWDKRVEAVKYAWEVMQGQCSDGDGFTERAAHDLDNAINALASPAATSIPAPADGEAKRILDEIGLALEEAGYFHMTNAAGIRSILGELVEAQTALAAPASAKVEAEG